MIGGIVPPTNTNTMRGVKNFSLLVTVTRSADSCILLLVRNVDLYGLRTSHAHYTTPKIAFGD